MNIEATVWEQRRTRYPNLHPRIIRIRKDDFDGVSFEVAHIDRVGTLTWKRSGRTMKFKNLLKEYKLSENGMIERDGVLYGLGVGSLSWAPLTVVALSTNTGHILTNTSPDTGPQTQQLTLSQAREMQALVDRFKAEAEKELNRTW